MWREKEKEEEGEQMPKNQWKQSFPEGGKLFLRTDARAQGRAGFDCEAFCHSALLIWFVVGQPHSILYLLEWVYNESKILGKGASS